MVILEIGHARDEEALGTEPPQSPEEETLLNFEKSTLRIKQEEKGQNWHPLNSLYRGLRICANTIDTLPRVVPLRYLRLA
jgi:hypothetical protein